MLKHFICKHENTSLLITILFIFIPSAFAQKIEKETIPKQEPTWIKQLTRRKNAIKSAEMNFQFFTSVIANSTSSNFEGMNIRLNRVWLKIKGYVWKSLSYHYFIKYLNPYSLDNLSSPLELVYINLKVHDKFSSTLGKLFINFGRYEYFVNSIKVREFSESNKQTFFIITAFNSYPMIYEIPKTKKPTSKISLLFYM